MTQSIDAARREQHGHFGQENLGETIGQGLGYLFGAAGSFARRSNPKLAVKLAVATIKRDYSDEMFRSPEMVTLLADMNQERTPAEKILHFRNKSNLIIANHEFLPAILAAVASRLPEGSPMPYIFVDIGKSMAFVDKYEDDRANPSKFLSEQFAVLQATAPFMLASTEIKDPDARDRWNRKAQELTRKEGEMFHTGRSLIQRIREIQATDPNYNFLVFIEGNPSRGNALRPANEGLVFLSNLILRNDPNAGFEFVGYNGDTKTASQISVPRQQDKYDAKFFEDTLAGVVGEATSPAER